ncbi:unnamed protein product [Clavelina lepadiformis]|uniref:DegT/DnrJ/EryC1/StrS aminotransferase family protein n=1 Tax=Clavelina lepadiformis TaxID=159417 RepID=A0ABP0H3C2_CLALP
MNSITTMVPHACFFIDSPLKARLEGFELLLYSSETPEQRRLAEEDLERLWKDDDFEDVFILPCLSVRTGLDLFLSIRHFPPGSEFILSGINIPTITKIIEHHGLKVRSCDINLETMGPSIEIMASLVSNRTVAVLVAHLYGKRFDMQPVIDLCKRYSIPVLEDCAEAFSGLGYKGHPESDISLFSFGTIKFSTAYGGAIMRIKNKKWYDDMKSLYSTYPVQSKFEYGKKLAKYFVISPLLNNTFLFRTGISAFKMVGVDHKEVFTPFIRSFRINLITSIRYQPSVILLNNLTLRLSAFDEAEHKIVKEKGDYVAHRLPYEAVAVGQKACDVNYWLFPILVEKQKEVTKMLNDLGVDSTIGSTQLAVVVDSCDTHDSGTCCESCRGEHVPNAKFLMDHVVYLPVHKLVPYHELDKIVNAVHKSVKHFGCQRLTLPSSSKFCNNML